MYDTTPQNRVPTWLRLDDQTMPIIAPKPDVDYKGKEVVKRVPSRSTGKVKMGKRKAPEKPFLRPVEIQGRIKKEWKDM